MRKSIVKYGLCLLMLSMGLMQTWAQGPEAKRENKVTLVYLEHSETLSFDEANLPETQVLRGNVRFRHDSALLYCDSAYFYEKRNSLDAFGRVRIEQGDTLVGHRRACLHDPPGCHPGGSWRQALL